MTETPPSTPPSVTALEADHKLPDSHAATMWVFNDEYCVELQCGNRQVVLLGCASQLQHVVPHDLCQKIGIFEDVTRRVAVGQARAIDAPDGVWGLGKKDDYGFIDCFSSSQKVALQHCPQGTLRVWREV